MRYLWLERHTRLGWAAVYGDVYVHFLTRGNMARILRFVAIGLATLVFPAAASAGALTLHPSGFGTHSYSAWKAHQGLPDSKGNDDQALYFQKMVPSTTFAAGVAVIKGVEGLPVSALDGLSWDHRTDGHCGAGAPRWNVGVDVGGQTQTFFFGCFAAEHMPIAPNWCHDTIPSAALNALPQGATLRSLAIVFDEGTENVVPQPPPCLGTAAAGFVYLDNITVTLNGVPHTWTGASDNGNGQSIMQSSDPLEQLLDAPLATPFP